MRRAFLALLFSFFALVTAQAQVVNGKTLVEPRLLASVSEIEPGKPFQVGVHLKIEDGWHTYWVNSGDSGIPITLEWKLPPGWKAGEIQWPLPQKHIEPGDIVTYGYEGDLLLMVELTPPAEFSAADAPAPAAAELKVEASWLVCDQSCVPGSGELALTLPVANGEKRPPTPPEDAALFAKFNAQLPQQTPPPFTLKWEPHDTEVYLKIEGAPSGTKLEFYPVTPILRHPEPLGPTSIRIPYPQPPEPAELDGLLIATAPDGTRQGWSVHHTNERGDTSGSTTAAAADGGKSAAASGQSGGGTGGGGFKVETLAQAILYGFAGGFILNLMPCVLPVIALKIFGFINQVGESRQRVFRLGMAFVAGIFAWFMLLALLVVGARMAGHEVTWAFQFQNPKFLLGMAVLIFIFALNLIGVFEIWLPGTAKLAAASEKKGYSGAFLHGVFATLLATPCTAPLLGAAVAFAFTQSSLNIFLIFFSVAAGMGFPYVLLSAQPAWMRFLPRPGNWMVRLKQIMGFLLLATVAWLFEALGETAASTIWLFLSIGIGCWIFGMWVQPTVSRGRQAMALFSIAGVITLGSFLSQPKMEDWEPWSPERMSTLLQEGKPVFVDFTADWCVNCKYNENFVLNRKAVKDAMKGFVTLKADWTKGDKRITAELKRLGRAGVPVYAVYPPNAGEGAMPDVLPEILTQATVIDALKKAKQ